MIYAEFLMKMHINMYVNEEKYEKNISDRQ